MREVAGLLDLPGFTKLAVEGPGAVAMLDRLLCTRLPRVGRAGLAYALNERGRIVSEFTVARLGEERFYLCSAASAEWHDADLLAAARPGDGSVRIDDLTARFGTLVLAGPRARDILAPLVDLDLATACFPWLAATEAEVGNARGVLLRLSYLGELGYELHLPVEHLVGVYERLLASGAPAGLREIGIYAVESLRLDKAYRAWKGDIDLGVGPFAAGLGRFVDLGKPDFVGRTAVLAERESRLRRSASCRSCSRSRATPSRCRWRRSSATASVSAT